MLSTESGPVACPLSAAELALIGQPASTSLYELFAAVLAPDVPQVESVAGK